ncbi:MAG: MFS transporter [Chloroflexota bacterium]
MDKFEKTPRWLRWVLGLNRPEAVLSAAEADAAREHNFRWNVTFNSLDVFCFYSGINLISATTILPLFVSKLSDSPIPLALLAMIAQGGFFLPQLFTSNFIERLDHKKPMVVNLGFFTERVPMILLPFIPLLALAAPTLALVLFLAVFAWFMFGGGVIAPAWQDMIARCFTATTRGRFFGITLFVGALIGVGASAWASYVLENVIFPNNFVLLFSVAGVAFTLSWFFLMQVREPIEAGRTAEVSARDYLTQLPSLVKADVNFRNFLIARFVIALAEMGTGFLTVAAIQTFGVSDGTVAQFTIVTLVGQTAASLIMGFFSDKYGHHLSFQIATITLVIAFGAAWLATGTFWYFVVFFCLGFFNGTRAVSAMLVVLEFSGPEKRPTYVGIANTITGIASILAPVIGGGLALLGYNWLFVASTAVSVLGFLLLRYWVQEPRFVAG